MGILHKFNQILDRTFAFLIPVGLIVGMMLGGRITFLSVIVPFMFGLVTFIGSLNMDFKAFKKTITTPIPIGLTMLVLRVIVPIGALVIGHLVFPNHAYARVGLLLFATIPTGINSAVWVMIHKGKIALTLSVILLDTLISPFVLPFSIALLAGATTSVDTVGMMISLLQMIVIPSILGMAVNQLSKGEVPKKWNPRLSPIAKLGLVLVVMINGATVAPYFTTFDRHLLLTIATVFTLASFGYTTAWLLAKLAKMNQETTIAIVFSGGLRNVSTGAVIAIAYFPIEAALPVVAGLLFQQIFAAIVGGMMKRYFATGKSQMADR